MNAATDAPRLGARDTTLLVAIVIIAAWLRFGFLDARGWWLDEAATVVGARLEPLELLRHVRAHERHPPLYFLLVAAWARAAGTTEAGLRSLSAVLGVGTVVIAYAAARRLVSVRAGLVAAALAAVNPMLVWLSLEARMYALLIALGGGSFLCFARALEEPRGRTLGAWAAVSALALWTHYFAVFVIAPEAAWLVLRHPRSHAVRWGGVALALAGAALFPFLTAASALGPWIAHGGWSLRAASVVPEFLLGFQPPSPLLLTPVAILTPAIALWLLAARADAAERRGAVPAVVVGGAALIVPALVSLVPPFDLLRSRYLSAAAVPLLVAVAAGLGARRAGRLGLATVVLTCVAGIAIDVGTAHVSKFGHEDWRAAAAAVGRADGPRALVVTPARGRLPLQMYRPRVRRLEEPRVTVSEIVVVALPPIFRTLGQPSVPPRPPSPPPPDASFQLVERIDAESFTLLRYRAAAPVTMDRPGLAVMSLGQDEPVLLLELPGDQVEGGR